ncbi:cell division control protein 45 [Exophiala aquamarina CBS 119918]|uniref:Cell division control protein 45 n=1 Tax=Exophiala aquamarina CBS 119918 TaxID=1182545 RepID=A0A072NX51_9EURO|nr:cell division control protein 45 [Exophiala aquamarina CBS 119918]KEF52439.1 cell division control protein 45 [Exophiala aquamarina CBS 119918]
MYLPRSLISLLYTNLVRSHHPLSPPVLLLVSFDPDSLCACRILASLLKRDYIPHKIQPVSGYADLSKAGEELVQPMKTTDGGSGGVVICLGVGGLVDLAALLGLEVEDSAESMCGVEVWVLDARRPCNLSNVFGGLPSEAAVGSAVPRIPGVDKGRIQRSYKPGKGGIIVFDDGDISNDLEAERDAYCALADMPEVEADSDSDDDEQSGDEDAEEDQDEGTDTERSPSSKKRKSWSDKDSNASDSDDAEERPRQRRRANSGSSINSTPQSRTPTSSQPTSPTSKSNSPKQATAKQLRKRLRKLRRSHEIVLEKYNGLGISYSEPISTLAYSLASDLGREDNDLLWLAIVGVTSLELSGHTSTSFGKSTRLEPSVEHPHSWRSNRSRQTYAILRDETRRLNPPPMDQSPSVSPGSGVNSPSDTSIRLTPDPRFLLLRHWSLYDSMLHSPYLASRLKVWNESGVKRLHKLLAKMGVSLSQCKQTYTHMDMDLKKTLRERLLKYAPVYGLDDLVPTGAGRFTYDQDGWGFIRSWGWKAQLSAVDVGLILGAILDVGSPSALGSNNASTPAPTLSQSQQTTDSNPTPRSLALVPRFFAAYDALAPSHPTQLLTSIPQAQYLLRSILRTGSSLLVKHQIRHLRAFRMGVVKDGPDLGLFANSPGALVKLALWVGEAVSGHERDREADDSASHVFVPLVLAALDEERGTYVIVGTGGGDKSNRFGLAFQEVVQETDARVEIDSFDHSVVEVKKEDLGAFLEALSLKAVVGA